MPIDEKVVAKGGDRRRNPHRGRVRVPTPAAPSGPEQTPAPVAPAPAVPASAAPASARPSWRSVVPQVAALTRSPGKAERYAEEPYLRESWADLVGVLGDDAGPALLRHGLVMLRPDGLTLDRSEVALDFFRHNGFRVVAAAAVDVTSLHGRTLWTYQLTQATLDRVLLNDLIMRGPGLLLLLRADRPDELPAAVRLSLLKGPAAPEHQAEGCLRRAIDQPNRIFSLVHSADEPLDVVRELGLLLDGRHRRRFAAAMASGRPADVGPVLAGLPVVTKGFDPRASFRRIRDAIRTPAGAVRPGLRAGLDALAGHGILDFTGFLTLVDDAGIDIDPWDLAVAASEVIRFDDEDGAKLIDNLGPEVWL